MTNLLPTIVYSFTVSDVFIKAIILIYAKCVVNIINSFYEFLQYNTIKDSSLFFKA